MTGVQTCALPISFSTGFSRKRKLSYQITLQIIWAIAFVFIGMRLTILGMGEGLLLVKYNLDGYNNERETVIELTNENDIIIVDRSDKILFPHRNVIVPLRSETTYSALPLIIDTVEQNSASLYYYGMTLPEEDIVYLQETRLEPFGLKMEEKEEINNKTLYKIFR